MVEEGDTRAGLSSKVAIWQPMCGVIAPPVLASLVLLTERLTPGYSPLSETVSRLATEGRPHPELVTTAFVLYGLLVNAFAFGLYHRIKRLAFGRQTCLLFAVHGAGIALSAVFRDDPSVPGASPSLEARLHNAFSLAAVLAMLAGIALFTVATRAAPAWRGYATFSTATILFLLVLSPFPHLEVFKPVEGLLQRVSHLLLLGWVQVIAVRVLHLGRADMHPSRSSPG